MFEVGKKYKYMANQVVYNCISAGSNWAVLQFGEATPFVTQAVGLYTEYKEPRTITRWINVYKDIYGDLSFGHMYGDETKARANGHCNGAIATIPITYTEPR